MTVLETLEGVLEGKFWFHYDVRNDVLYVRLDSRRRARALGEETDDGLILLRDSKTDEPIGLTIVNWWKRFGKGALPDSIAQIQKRIAPLSRRIAA